MKAAQLTQYGIEGIRINDIDKPTLKDNQVLVEIHAAGVNPFDYKIAYGYMKDFIPVNLPETLGGDFSGMIIDIGPNVAGYKVGDEVYGQTIILSGGSGSFAEFAAAPVKNIAFKPKKLTHEEAGALPLAGVSAIQAITEHIKLQKNQKILIHGGAGGIGTIAIQIAKSIGAYVATTVSANDIEYVKKLGADEVIDYKSTKFENVFKDYDAVFDLVGGEITNRSINVLKNSGALTSMIQPADEDLVKAKQINFTLQGTKVTTDKLNHLTDLVENGIITIYIEKTFPLTEATAALTYLHETPPRGKVVIKMK